MNRVCRSLRRLDGFTSVNLAGSVALAAIALGMLVGASGAVSAQIAWDEPINILAETDIDRSAGPIIKAINSTNETESIDVIIGGQTISFEPVDFSTLDPGSGSQSANGGFLSNNGGSTGNTELDAVLDSHSWTSGTDISWQFELTDLSPGEMYQIQIFGAADRRGCCADRTITAGDGEGNTSGEFTRGGPGSVTGLFTADAATQIIEIGTGVVNGVDPGVSGYVLSFIDTGALPGDVNQDEMVDILDYEIIRDNLFTGIARNQGDLNFSGLVDIKDFRIWKDAFNAAGAIPEPTTAGLMLIGGVLCGLGRRRRTG